MTVWLELRGRGATPKAAKALNWTDLSYRGIDPLSMPGGTWVGMRLDQNIVVDCDNYDAMDAWLRHIDQPDDHTLVRKTPHGWHFIYQRTPDTYSMSTGTGQLKGIHEKIDFKVGPGHQIVFYAPGYETVHNREAGRFNLAWIPEGANTSDRPVDDWSEMPDGIGDNAMISFAGKFREWGMDEETMAACLRGINEVTMTKDPMPDRTLRRIAHSAARYEPADPIQVMCPKCGSDVEVR